MNEFSEIENELKKLRPARPSGDLIARVAGALEMQPNENKIIRPARFQVNWLGLGLGLAAAATFLILARVDFHPVKKTQIASATAAPQTNPAAALPDYRAAGLTQVVYGKRDEGLIFPRGSQQPMRRLRTEKRETLHWQDQRTGAQLQISYPTEEVRLIPVSGQ